MNSTSLGSWIRRVVAGSLVIALVACGGGDGGASSSPLTVESSAGVSASVGASGATLAATASAGTRYSLAVPAGAVRQTVTIAVTPITAVNVAPLNAAKVVAAVRMEPSGTTFATMAKLTIDLPAGTSTAGLVGFIAEGDGSSPHLVPISVHGQQVTLLVPHFSVGGLLADASAIPPPPPNQATALAQHDVAVYLASLNGQLPDIPTLALLYRAWYHGIVRSDLVAAAQIGGTDASFVAAVSENDEWILSLVQTVVDFDPTLLTLLDALHPDVAESLDFVRAIAARAIAQSNASCLAEPATPLGQTNALIAASNVMFWQSVAQRNRGGAPPLDFATVRSELCVQLDNAVAFAPQVSIGQTVPLTVLSSILAGSQPITNLFGLVDVSVEPASAVIAAGQPASGPTRADGTFATQLTVQQLAVVVNVHSCIDNLVAAYLSTICKDTLITRNNGASLDGVWTGQFGFELLEVTLTTSGASLGGSYVQSSGSDTFNGGLAGSISATINNSSLDSLTITQTARSACQTTFSGSATSSATGDRISGSTSGLGTSNGLCSTVTINPRLELRRLGSENLVQGRYVTCTAGCSGTKGAIVLQYGNVLFMDVGGTGLSIYRVTLTGTSFTGSGIVTGGSQFQSCVLRDTCLADPTRTISGTIDSSGLLGTEVTPMGSVTVKGQRSPN